MARSVLPKQTKAQLVDENRRLRIALADAIRRPPGVIPESAWEFCSFQAVEETTASPADILRGLAIGEIVRISHEMGLA